MNAIEVDQPAATVSRVNYAGYMPQTRGTPKDDWVMPEVESANDNRGETTLEKSGAGIAAPNTTTTAPAAHKVSPAVRKGNLRSRASDRSIKLLQQWECIVLAVHGDSVECEMHDLTDSSRAVEWAEVYLDEFNLFDRPLLAEGAVFYWSIGREETRTGTIRRYSELRVRRMPPLSKIRLQEIAEEAAELSELFSK